MQEPIPRTPLLNFLERKGYALFRHEGEEVVTPEKMDPAQGEAALAEMVEAFTVYEDGITNYDVERLENALEAIKARIEGDYDLPALVAVGPLGDKDADILRIINEVLHE